MQENGGTPVCMEFGKLEILTSIPGHHLRIMMHLLTLWSIQATEYACFDSDGHAVFLVSPTRNFLYS